MRLHAMRFKHDHQPADCWMTTMVPVGGISLPVSNRIARCWPALPAFALTLLTASGAVVQA